MLFLTAVQNTQPVAVQNTQPDFVALGMILALAVVVAIMAIRKKLSGNKPKEAAAPIAPQAPKAAEPAPGTAGQMKLHGVDPKTAAMLMAIVADKLDKPLNELRFISVKEVE